MSKEINPSVALSAQAIAPQQMVFAKALVKWQRAHGRHDLPWQVNLHPYPVWLSEVMLQQTQVSTVKAYFSKFMLRFPTVQDLAHAQEDEVMALWSGLGYYSRGRNLHACAKAIVARFGGEFPRELESLMSLPGIGPSTAAAIASICFAQKTAIMDGNVSRVLARYLGYEGDLSQSVHQKMLHQFACTLLPSKAQDMPTYTQGIMDLGATVCTPKRVLCNLCPVQKTCQAYARDQVLLLPFKSRKVKRKQKSIFWLIASNAQGEVLGGKRASSGVWGGMYAFPEFENEGDLRDAVPQGVNLRVLTVLRHELTHQSLSIHGFASLSEPKHRPKGCTVSSKTALDPWGNWAGFQWMTMKDWAQVGRPKPVEDFLNQIVQAGHAW
jgi:A/G-specific adenine glycosylase